MRDFDFQSGVIRPKRHGMAADNRYLNGSIRVVFFGKISRRIGLLGDSRAALLKQLNNFRTPSTSCRRTLLRTLYRRFAIAVLRINVSTVVKE